MSNKIVFLVPSRYPTEKAYGVTIGRTCASLRELGIQAEIAAPNEDLYVYDIYGNKVCSLFQGKNWLRWIHKISTVHQVNFVFWLLLCGLVSVRIFRSFRGVLVYREVYLILFPALFLRRANHVLEIHHSPKGLRKTLTQLILKCRNVKLVCIAPNIRNSIAVGSNAEKIALIGMGVPREFFRVSHLEQTNRISICFLGKAESNGHPNGILEFTDMICQIPVFEKIVLGFVGLNSLELESQIRVKTESCANVEVKFVPHVSHDQVPKIVSEFNVGLLPYPENEYHRDRFPIKALEYAALGLTLLVSDTQSHRSIIPASCAFFFDHDRSDSLLRVIEKLKNLDLSIEKRLNARNWAEQFTYEKRAQEILNFIGI